MRCWRGCGGRWAREWRGSPIADRAGVSGYGIRNVGVSGYACRIDGETLSRMKPPREITVPIDTHLIAIAQARAFARVARSLSKAVGEGSGQHEQVLAYLVNAGLAVELHFKSLMIAARNGRVTTGHDLGRLYSEFPTFLTDFIEWQYKQLVPERGWNVVLSALTFRSTPPPPPSSTPAPRYGTFTEAIQTSSHIFEDGRYFFEKVHVADWAIFAYAPAAIDAVLESLDRAYVHFMAGDFAPKPPGGNAA